MEKGENLRTAPQEKDESGRDDGWKIRHLGRHYNTEEAHMLTCGIHFAGGAGGVALVAHSSIHRKQLAHLGPESANIARRE